MMLTTFLMFIAAVILSCIAGYYSVIGMTSIFSGAFIPIILMAGTLETSKVIVASWLYNNWRKTPILLKSYLTAAVVVLMFITSMGIFGFLSKAHIEQAANGEQQQAEISRLQQQIDAQTQVVQTAQKRLNDLNTNGEGGDAAYNARIAQANRIIEQANAQVQPQIDEQQRIIDAEKAKIELRAKDVQTQVDDVDRQVANLDAIVKALIDQKKTSQAQYKQDQQKKARDDLAAQKAKLIKQIDQMRNASNPTMDAAKAEITRIRAKVDADVKQARDTINSLTSELGKNVDTAKLQGDIDAQTSRMKAATDALDRLTAEKFKIESDSRKLEVEVGPVKYIAQMIYGDQVDSSLLERAVRWVIMTLIFVFDPLAVLMLIASNQGLAEWKSERASRKRTRREDAASDIEPASLGDHKSINDAIATHTVTTRILEDDGSIDALREAISGIESGEVEMFGDGTFVDPAPRPEPEPMPDPIPQQAAPDQQAVIDMMKGVIQDAVDSIVALGPKAEDTQIQDDTPVEIVFNDELDGFGAGQDDAIDDGSITDTEVLLDRLQRSHSARLRKYNPQTP